MSSGKSAQGGFTRLGRHSLYRSAQNSGSSRQPPNSSKCPPMPISRYLGGYGHLPRGRQNGRHFCAFDRPVKIPKVGSERVSGHHFFALDAGAGTHFD
mgnify:CR=1 FL=1